MQTSSRVAIVGLDHTHALAFAYEQHAPLCDNESNMHKEGSGGKIQHSESRCIIAAARRVGFGVDPSAVHLLSKQRSVKSGIISVMGASILIDVV